MTVINANATMDDAPTVAFEVEQCNAALLYADSVRLVSPRAAFMSSAAHASSLEGVDFIRLMHSIAPTYAPQLSPRLRQMVNELDQFMPRSQITAQERHRQRNRVAEFRDELEPSRQILLESAARVIPESRFDQLQLAVDAGLLSIDGMGGTGIQELKPQGEQFLNSIVRELEAALTDAHAYPLFDADAHGLVRDGVRSGFFTPVPLARRHGNRAAMASGLFDRLPSFPNADTSEILDIRDELARPLTAFRQGVRELSDKIEVNAEDEHFGAAVEEAWTDTVAPELEQIEDAMLQNSSLRDLAKRTIRDPAGLTTAGSLAALPGAMGIAAGPWAQLGLAATAAIGTGVTGGRVWSAQRDSLRDAQKAQFYFLYGTEARLKSR